MTVYEKTWHVGFFVKADFDQLFVVEIQRFVCNCATPPMIEKLQSKGVAMNVYGVSIYYM